MSEDSQVIIMLNTDMIDTLTGRGFTIGEYCLLIMFTRRELLDNYLKRQTDDQKKATLQTLVRKQLLQLKEGIESFSVQNYALTEVGKDFLEVMNTGDNSIIELVGRTPIVKLNNIPDEFGEFIDKYLELFPKGVKNGGNKSLRSNVIDVRAKMLKFISKYKHDKETILKATENYIEKLRGSYTYCPTAEYFILKDGSSALATECDNVRNGSNELIDPFQKRM